MEVQIYELNKNRQQGGIQYWKDLMTDEEYKRGQHYNTQYLLRSAEIQKHKAHWDRLNELYACQREADAEDQDYPNNFVPLLTPCIEGQVASIIEGDIEFTHFTDNPLHTAYMKKFDAASIYARRMNRFTDHFKDFTRFYDLFGNAVLTVSWEEGFAQHAGKPKGFPRITVCPLLSVMFDGRIKDPKELQYSDYIIHEIGFQSIGWAREEYGDDKAEAISTGYNRYEGESPDQSIDDDYTFTLLHVWTRNNKQRNLQLIEMDANGFVLRISDPSKPYYEHVNNEYPFYFSRMIPVIGEFYGHGDGTILKPMQESVNNLTDELELAARFSAQSKILVDPKARMGVDQLTSNPAEIAICNDPNGNVKQLTGQGINPVVVTMIQYLLGEAQKATRFNEIMTGNQQGVSATATQINSQLTQGSVGIQDKKSDIARAMEWADRYCLKLALEYWDTPFLVSFGDSSAEAVDVSDMRKAPASVPVSERVLKKIKDKMTGFFKPGKITMDIAKGENGEMLEAVIDVYTKVYIGRGMSKDKTTMYNILVGLAGLLGIDETTGQSRSVISFKQLVRLLEDNLGIKLRSEGEEEPDLSRTATNIPAITGQNPIGPGGTVQKTQPVAENLMQTVPQMPSGDNRRLNV